ncbi:hypothetical protein [Brevibacillus laterosporus]|uniref:hypothetical protein n=1 Tax=Brevibacillus laterosporus TaxID=1465 RepID=UPI00195911B7|nr:hypothetical protein [Brevibacillus laterosporus]MBM7106859.1 hypothetical protein [Brevibacillus laterosporus]
MLTNYQLANIEAEIERLVTEQEKTKAEIRQLEAWINPAKSKLNQLLAFDARLTDCIRMRQAAVMQLKLKENLIH